MSKKIVTTSWDDGHPLDLRLCDLLTKYRLSGTFYMPLKNSGGRAVLNENDIRELSEQFEVGAHTYNHRDLTRLTKAEVREEILTSKYELENILQKKVNMFCFPRGHFNASLVDVVKSLGFRGARTNTNFLIRLNTSCFLMPVTLQVYHHTFSGYMKHFLRELNFTGFYNYMSCGGMNKNFVNLTKAIFDKVAAAGGVFHLWGHSWEIEEHGLWGELEAIFKHISNRNDFLYLSNSECLDYCSQTY